MKNEKKEKLINNKGITLIVLVVTITIMLILAGVSMGSLTGRDAILDKTQHAVNEYEERGREEEKQLNEFTKSFNNEDEGKEIEDNFDQVMNETMDF